MKNKLIDRIKKGKEWLTLNRLEWLDFHGYSRAYDHKKFMKSFNLYCDLFDEGFKKGLVEPEWFHLFNPWAIEDLIEELHKIFPENMFEN